jgi:hypothetical protein
MPAPAKMSLLRNPRSVQGHFAFRNSSSVKLYPDVVKRDMHVVAKDNDGKEIDFFVFDLQGTLVKNYKMKAKGSLQDIRTGKGSVCIPCF